MELGGESQDGTSPLLIMRRDVDDECGADGREGGGIQDFERTVRFAVDGQLLKAGEKAGFVAECRGMVMVGVAGFPIRKNDSFGPKLSNDAGEAEFVLAAGLDIGVWHAKRAAPPYAKDLGGFGCFFGAGFGSA